MKRTLNGTTTYYIYDGEKPILEYKSSDLTHPAKNLYGKGIDEILMRTDPTVNSGQPFYYQQDHEGSATHLVNAAGTVLESYRYDAFGSPTMYNGAGAQIASTAYNNRFLFTGREYAATYQKTYIAALNFYEYRARGYHPGLGRFMSEDPKLFGAGDYNLFRYCHNDPLDLTDPMGLEEATGLLQMGTHDRVWDDRAYNKAMADAQRTMHDAHGGAIGIGKAGYQTWSALQRMAAAFRAEVQRAIAGGERLAQLGNNAQPRTLSHEGSLQIDDDGIGPDHGDPLHRNYTSYQPNGRSLNADIDRYVALPTSTMHFGARAGDRAVLSGNGRSASGVVGDFGSPGWVEASVAFAHALGITTIDRPGVGPVPNTPGGRDVPVTVTVYPSGQ